MKLPNTTSWQLRLARLLPAVRKAEVELGRKVNEAWSETHKAKMQAKLTEGHMQLAENSARSAWDKVDKQDYAISMLKRALRSRQQQQTTMQVAQEQIVKTAAQVCRNLERQRDEAIADAKALSKDVCHLKESLKVAEAKATFHEALSQEVAGQRDKLAAQLNKLKAAKRRKAKR